jgi:hypothetical protein
LSTLISLPAGNEDLSVVDDEASGLDLSVPTLAAATTRDRVAIQVTSSSLNLSVIGDPALRYSSLVDNHPSERVIAAAASGSLSLLAAAIRNGDNVRIEIWKVERSEAGLGCRLVGQPIPLAHEPICLSISRLDSRDLLSIGTSDGNLLVGWIDCQGPIRLAQQTIEYPDDHDDSKACESLSLLITATPGYPKHTLVCGLRSGYVALVNLTVSHSTSEIRKMTPFALVPVQAIIDVYGTDSKPLELRQDFLHRLGDTPVRVHGYECETSFAIAGCGSGLWWLSHPEDRTPGFAIEKVWITNQADVSILWQIIISGTDNQISDPEFNSPPVRNPPSRHSAAWNHNQMATRVALGAR